MSLHPIHTTEHLRQTYIRYLKTIKPFRDPVLQQEFARAIEQPGMLIKGPLMEASPPFKTGGSLADLVADGVLSPRFAALDGDALPYHRPLYVHQERAVRKAVAGRNIIVATGTGSGKTEAFLIPILNHLLQEAEAGTLKKAGVRALLLYPMNALANDQMKRLRAILSRYPQITFGRYVGNTPNKEDEARRQFESLFPGEPMLPNELLSRQVMRAAPPHILLTNYAMLEYLLLRPNDSPFFDGATAGRWRFVVLDEAHVYTGAKATEVGMLLRRLLDRVTQGHPTRIQAIATSATLGQARDDHFQRMARFASNLFGLLFEWVPNEPDRQDIVIAERLPQADLEPSWGEGTPALYACLVDLIQAQREGTRPLWPEHLPDVPSEVARRAAGTYHQEHSLLRALFTLLRGDARLHRLRDQLRAGPQDFRALARHLFPELEESAAFEALNHLVSAAIMARKDTSSAPLLPARYHVFARALEGAFVCLNRDHLAHQAEGKPRLFLQRHRTCPHCGGRVFELATCTNCGAAYLVGKIEAGDGITGGVLEHSSVAYERSQEARGPVYFSLEAYRALWEEDTALGEAVESAAEEEAFEASEIVEEELAPSLVCPQCGQTWDANLSRPCACDAQPVQLHRVEMGQRRALLRCIHCSTPRRKGGVYRFLTSRDAPVSLLLQALYRELPEGQDKTRFYPGGGRKLISFADSRQTAAFFAPYVERVARREMRRQLIIRTLRGLARERHREVTLRDMIAPLKFHAEEAGVFPEKEPPLRRDRRMAAWLIAEFRPLDRRLSLEGVGLVRFAPERPPNWQPPERFLRPPWNLSPEEIYHLFTVLINSLRRQGAVIPLIPAGQGDPVTDAEFRHLFWPRAKAFYIQENNSLNRSSFAVFSWLPRQASNTREDYLVRLLVRRGIAPEQARAEAREALQEMWHYLTGGNTPWPGLLRREELPYYKGIAYRIDHGLWRARLTEREESLDEWWVCDRCGGVTAFQVHGVCPTYGCDGQLRPLSEVPQAWKDNLYRYAYLEGNPIPLRIEEHTAQWVPETAAEVQQKFQQGEINVLSCSTTFELGVDLGDLQAVVMHNVPPRTANYVQRAGRAGRRTDAVAYVLTFAQRRSHDLHFFQEPERMVAGEIRPPVVSLHNEKIVRRHVHSVVLAAYFRWLEEKHEIRWPRYKNTGSFFEDEAHEGINGLERLREFLRERPPELLAALKRIVPREPVDLQAELGLEEWAWVPYLISGVDDGPEEVRQSVLDLAAEEIRGELRLFRQLEEEAAKKRKYTQAEQFKRIQHQITHRSLLNYLGARNVLPKYGFPTDVVPLRTAHLTSPPEATKVQLERDLRMAISEFAPGGEVVAGKRIWLSQGIYRLPGREWVPYLYAVCPSCKRMQIRAGTKDEAEDIRCACGCRISKGNLRPFFVPELGFLAARETRQPGEEPPERIYAGELHFADYHVPDPNTGGPGQEVLRPEFEPVDSLSRGSLFVEKAYSRYGWLAVVNQGYGNGFRVCRVCGYAEPIAGGKKKAPSHHNPRSGEICKGTLRQWNLGHRFMTDVLEIRFHFDMNSDLARMFDEEPMGTATSVLYALLEGASRTLDIPREDINGTFYFPEGTTTWSPFAVVLLDAVAGGAGHAAYIGEYLKDVFAAAYQLVAFCECGEDTSCYNCLRSYDNQWHHDQLKRGLARDALLPFVAK